MSWVVVQRSNLKGVVGLEKQNRRACEFIFSLPAWFHMYDVAA